MPSGDFYSLLDKSLFRADFLERQLPSIIERNCQLQTAEYAILQVDSGVRLVGVVYFKSYRFG